MGKKCLKFEVPPKKMKFTGPLTLLMRIPQYKLFAWEAQILGDVPLEIQGKWLLTGKSIVKKTRGGQFQ